MYCVMKMMSKHFMRKRQRSGVRTSFNRHVMTCSTSMANIDIQLKDS